ncbi:MAG: hypothetical protein R8K20_10680, partial [Gallionellaceae bacterium]
MRSPKNNVGVVDWIALTLYKWWTKSAWFKWFLAPLATGVIPALVVIYYTVPVVKTEVVKWNSDIASLLDTYGLIALLLTAFYPTMLFTLARAIAHRVNQGGVDSLIYL